MNLQTKGRLTVNTIKGRAGISQKVRNNSGEVGSFQGYGEAEENILINQHHFGYFGRLARIIKR